MSVQYQLPRATPTPKIWLLLVEDSIRRTIDANGATLITGFTLNQKIWNLVIHAQYLLAEEVLVSDQGISSRLVPQDELSDITRYMNRLIEIIEAKKE